MTKYVMVDGKFVNKRELKRRLRSMKGLIIILSILAVLVVAVGIWIAV